MAEDGVPVPTMESIVSNLRTLCDDLDTLADAAVSGNAEVDVEYHNVATQMRNYSAHLHDLATNPRPSPESYSAQV
jgi:hypothetical protein